MLDQITSKTTTYTSWALTDWAIRHITIAQQCNLPVYVRFISVIDRSKPEHLETATVKHASDKNGLGFMLLEIFRDDIENDFIIHLKRTPSRILRPGTELVVDENGGISWHSAPEKAKAELVKDSDLTIFEV